MDTRSSPNGVLRLLVVQAGVVGGAVLLAAAFGGHQALVAAGLGGGLCWLAQAGFAWRVFRGDSRDAGQALRAMYRGEAFKLIVIALGFVAIFRYWPAVPPGPLFAAFIAVQVVHFLAPLLVTER